MPVPSDDNTIDKSPETPQDELEQVLESGTESVEAALQDNQTCAEELTENVAAEFSRTAMPRLDPATLEAITRVSTAATAAMPRLDPATLEAITRVSTAATAAMPRLDPATLEAITRVSTAATAAMPRLDPATLEAITRVSTAATAAMPRLDPATLEAITRVSTAATAAMPRLDPATLEAITRATTAAMPRLDPATLEAITRATTAAMPRLDPAIAEFLSRGSVLSKQETFETPPDDQRGFSPHLVRTSQVFEATESGISDLRDFTKVVQTLQRKNPGLPLVWRGQQNADWGLHSSLYRLLLEERSVDLPSGKPVGTAQRFPSEAEMVAVERALFDLMRPAWRMDNMPGLELLARLQHHGGPTRFLDVTRNPLMALWFAVEPSDGTTNQDARLFAIATQPVLPEGAASPPRYMESPTLTQGTFPFWLEYSSDRQRRSADWGTGTKRRVWIPPVYDERISAQNAAFLLEGLPIPSEELLDVISKSSEAEVSWRWADLAAAACFYVLPARVSRKVRPRGHRLAPVFTFRVPAAAKQKIWDELSDMWGLSPGVVYPDIQGLGQHLRKERGWVADALSRVDSQQNELSGSP